MLTISGRLRYDVLLRLIPPDVSSVLEIGAGKGGLGALLARDFDYLGLEPDAESYAFAHRQLGDRVLPIREEDFAQRQFDAVCAFELLEHIEDDVGALRDWRARLNPGGHLFLSVPSGRERYGPLDERAGHFRRYDRHDLELVLSEAGFTRPVIVSYGFPIGYLLLAGLNLAARRAKVGLSMESRTAASGRWLQPTPTTAALTRGVAMPFALIQRPFGNTSLGIGFVSRATAHQDGLATRRR
jgi:SAM-dependent methyltransferase